MSIQNSQKSPSKNWRSIILSRTSNNSFIFFVSFPVNVAVTRSPQLTANTIISKRLVPEALALRSGQENVTETPGY